MLKREVFHGIYRLETSQRLHCQMVSLLCYSSFLPQMLYNVVRNTMCYFAKYGKDAKFKNVQMFPP